MTDLPDAFHPFPVPGLMHRGPALRPCSTEVRAVGCGTCAASATRTWCRAGPSTRGAMHRPRYAEVQTGIGLCGSLFAQTLWGVEPNILTLGNGLGGGVPIGAMLARESMCCFAQIGRASCRERV